MNIVVFDIETTDLVPKGELTDDVLCGIQASVACAFDYMTGEYSVYMQDNMGALWYRLSTANLIVGFNIQKFDLPVLKCQVQNDAAQGGSTPEDLKVFDTQLPEFKAKSYDLYLQVKAGANADMYDRGYKCDDVLQSTWGAHKAKTGSGADAPRLWKEKRFGDLVSYCLADVHRERLIFERCWTTGFLRSTGYRDGKEDIAVIQPQEVLSIQLGQVLPKSTPLPFLLEGPAAPAASVPGPAHNHAPVQVRLASTDI
jgi:hypothetical protein